jgi:hypothetical protein
MPAEEQDNSYVNRLAALRLIRENMFLDKPKEFGWSDVIEDLPGSARAIAPIFKNVLPSQVIISKDPEERKKQIQTAIDRIKSTTNSKKSIVPEVLSSAGRSAAAAALPATLIAGIVHALGIRGLKKTLPNGKTKFQLPIDPINTIKHIFSSRDTAKHFLKGSLGEGALGTSLAALHGGAVPLSAHSYHISDKSLEDARNIMQEQPQLTGLPVSEMMSVRKEDTSNESPIVKKLKSIAGGAGVGLALGAEGGLVPSIMSAVGTTLGNIGANAGAALWNKMSRGKGALAGAGRYIGLDKLQPSKTTAGVREAFTTNLKRDLINAGKWGAGAGAIAGGLTKQLPSDDQEARRTNQA